MNSRAPVSYSVDADRVGWIVLDDATSRANVLNTATRAAFSAALDAASADAPRALVIASGKEKIFIAGADLKELAALADVTTATAFAQEGEELFERVANFPVP